MKQLTLPILALVAFLAACVAPRPDAPPWTEVVFDDTTIPGSVLITGTGSGPSKETAREKAKENALREAASIISVKVNGQFDGIQEVLTQESEEGRTTISLDIARSRTHTRTNQSLRGAVVRPPLHWKEKSGDEWTCRLRIELPRTRLFPQERLCDLLNSPERRAEDAVTLAQQYRIEGQGALAELAARLAAQWAPASREPLLLLADLAGESGDLIGKIAALVRLADLSGIPERDKILRRIERLRKSLLTPEDLISRIRVGCEKRSNPEDFSLDVKAARQGYVFSFSSREGGYLSCLWLDEDGVGGWAPTDAVRGSNHWPPGGHVLHPLELSLPGPVTLLAFLTPAPLSFESLLPIPAEPSAQGGDGGHNDERLRRLYLLMAAVEEAFANGANRTASVTFTVR